MTETETRTGAKTEELHAACKARGLNYIGTRGPQQSPVCIVGEAPGADEDRAGLPFVGASGKELGRMLADAGFRGTQREITDEKIPIFDAEDIWFTNAYKVRPPENKLSRLEKYGIPNELYVAQFMEELALYKPSIIVAMGATALGALCPNTASRKTGIAAIGTWRGSLLISAKLPWPHYIIPCYHPAFILREWSERAVAVLCLERAREELDYLREFGVLQSLPSRILTIQPSFDILYGFLYTCVSKRKKVSIDIEMSPGGYKYPFTIALADSASSGISFSLWDYDSGQLVKIWRLLDDILTNNEQIGQNYISFDCVWLESLGFSVGINKTTDTMIMHHALWPELSHRLQFLGLQYTREPYWKDEGKHWSPKEGMRSLMHYNALDAVCTFEIAEAMEKELSERSSRNEHPRTERTMQAG